MVSSDSIWYEMQTKRHDTRVMSNIEHFYLLKSSSYICLHKLKYIYICRNASSF